MNGIRRLFFFAISNFGPIAVFYGANHFWGLRTAVIATFVWSMGEIAVYTARKQPISAFFLFSAAITVLFGLIDIYLQQSVLFKYEGAMTNVIFGLYFASSLFGRKTLIQGFAEARGRLNQELTPDAVYYFRFLTGAWVAYFMIKASAYAWIARHYSLEQALVIRGTVGNATFYAMLFLSIGCAKQIKAALAQLRLLPSTRKILSASF